MKSASLSAETTVAAALEQYPGVARVFITRHTACVGCYMARFCTLWEAATIYQLPWDALIEDMHNATVEPNPSLGGDNA